MTAHWQHFSHPADMGLRGFGPTEAAAFEQIALAMTAVITDPEHVEPRETVTVDCAAPDDETLLVDWLNALVYEMATRDMLFSRFSVELADGRLHGEARGERVDRRRHQPAVEVKGATYTELAVGRNSRGEWFAQCVVDV